mgnify:FL=1
MFKQRTTMDPSGTPMKLWLQYEDGLHEPVRKDGDLHKKSRAPGNADWWVVPKAPGWKPEDDGFRTTDNHPGPPHPESPLFAQDTTQRTKELRRDEGRKGQRFQDTRADRDTKGPTLISKQIRPQGESPDPADIMADIASGADDSLAGRSMHAGVPTGKGPEKKAGRQGQAPEESDARRHSREKGKSLGSALKKDLEAFADGYVDAPDPIQILIQGGLSRSRPEAARDSAWRGMSGGNIAAHVYDMLHDEDESHCANATRRKKKP